VALLRGLGRVGLDFAFTGVAAVLLLALVAPAAGAGLLAVAAAHLARAIAVMPVRFIAVGRACGLDRSAEVRASMPLLASALAMAGIVLAWQAAAARLPAPLILAGSVGIGALAYASALAVLARPLAAEAAARLAPAFARGRGATG
jgi:hypothetical protein